MKLLRLKLEAFGPYSGSEIIDFRALRYSKLFLIHGPVGSGKTFLLDGICFALYGRSSGGERSRKGLRNLVAVNDQDTIAALDFQSGSNSYRVERRFNLQSDEVVLYRLPEIGEPGRRDILSATDGGVSSMIVRLLGLIAEQFCQVAILPQGRFRRFLLAPGNERRDILSNMFKAERHLRLQEAISTQAETAGSLLKEAWGRRESLIGAYESEGGDPHTSLHRSREELETVQEACKGHQERSIEWEKSLEEAVRYEVLDRQRDVSERELQALNGEVETTEEALNEQLRRSLPEYEKWRLLREESEEIEEELQGQRVQYEKLRANTNFLEAEVERARLLEEERFTLKSAQERLRMLYDDTRGLDVLSEEMERTEKRVEDLDLLRQDLAAQVRESKARSEEIYAELETIEEAAEKLASLKSDLRRIEELQIQARQNEMLEDAYQQALDRQARFEDMVSELKEERGALESRLSLQKERELTDSLRELKKLLVSGEECPLCGSPDHPKPFDGRGRRRADVQTEEEALTRVRERLKMAKNELAQAKQRRARLEGRMEERDGEQAEGLELDDKTVYRLKQTVAAVEGRVGKKDELKRELRRLKTDSKPARIKLKKMRLLKERLASTLESIGAQTAERRKRVLSAAEELGLPENVAELETAIAAEEERIAERLDELNEVTYSTERAELMAETFALQLAETRAAEKRRDSLLQEATSLEDSLKKQFRKHFSNWDDLSFAFGRLAREISLEGQESVLDRETLIRTVERQLSQSQELLAGLPVPEMKAEQIRSALSREREQLELKVGRRAALEKAVQNSTEDVQLYDKLVVEIRELEERQKSFAMLEELASGKNGLNFHDWYLDRVFRKVIDAANLRLEVLAPNRFCLSLQEGLEVRVVDFIAGKERSATTLSGGESFLASLALALGLGDVLQAERDAVDRLQTLFIDEGFGYLDRRALEASLDCLESLKQEGRTVGIISHVQALRERIRAQIVVAPNDSPLPYGVERIQIFAD